MTPGDQKGEEIQRVDRALRVWRQGDCVLSDHWFVHRFAPGSPLTLEATTVAADPEAAGIDLTESAVLGLMIASQSCDLVRTCAERAFVEVCPLVEVSEEQLREIERGRRPQYAFVPGVAERQLVADLDRVMTLEKPLVAGWERTPGCREDAERRRLALALARKRVRFAFPDDFIDLVKKLQERLQQKHGKESEEGLSLRALREIRVRAAPAWDAESA